MIYSVESLLALKEAVSELIQAEVRATEKTEARSKLQPGTSRKLITSANARMISTCEDRDRKSDKLELMIKGMTK